MYTEDYKEPEMKMRSVKRYILTSNRAYADKQTDNGIISPVQSVKGVLHTKVQDNSILSMTVSGKRVTVDVGTDALSNISPKDKAAFSRAITDSAPITFTTTEDHIQAHIAGVTQDIVVPVNCHEKHLPLDLIDRTENMSAGGHTQKGTLVDFSRYRGAVIKDADDKLVFCDGLLRDSARDDMSKEKTLIGKTVYISQNEKTGLLNIQGLEKSVDKKPEMKPASDIKTTHIIRLTHREDLNGYTSVEGRDYQKPIFHQGASKVAGQLIEANPNYGTFTLEHPVYGRVGVSVGKRLFQGDNASFEALFKACEEKKPVAISLDKTGTSLTVAIKDGPTLVNKMQSPAIPFGLVDAKQVSAEKTYRGKLNAVHAEHSVELQTDKGPLIVYGRGGASAEVTLKKMMGKQVEVSAGKDNALVVKTLEHEKGLAR